MPCTGKARQYIGGLGERIAWRLAMAGIYTPKQIREMTDEELLGIKGVGTGTLMKIRGTFPYAGARI